MSTPACVLLWNAPIADEWGDERLQYYVACGDENGELIDEDIELCDSYEEALEAATERAKRYGFETIEEDCFLE